jgi:hypothetical protein
MDDFSGEVSQQETLRQHGLIMVHHLKDIKAQLLLIIWLLALNTVVFAGPVIWRFVASLE